MNGFWGSNNYEMFGRVGRGEAFQIQIAFHDWEKRADEPVSIKVLFLVPFGGKHTPMDQSVH